MTNLAVPVAGCTIAKIPKKALRSSGYRRFSVTAQYVSFGQDGNREGSQAVQAAETCSCVISYSAVGQEGKFEAKRTKISSTKSKRLY